MRQTLPVPFNQRRKEAGSLENSVVINLSVMCGRNLMRNYGVEISEGVLSGRSARAVIVPDSNNVARHTEMVGAIEHEPNYDAALAALG